MSGGKRVATAAGAALCACGGWLLDGCMGSEPAVVSDGGPSFDVATTDTGLDTGLDTSTPLDAGSDAIDSAADGPSARCDKTKPFGDPSPLGSGFVGTTTFKLSADELTIYYSATLDAGLSAVYARRASTSASFGAPVELPGLGATPNANPMVSTDDLTLVFASKRSGSFDLYSASRSTPGNPFTSPFGSVAELSSLNTALDEQNAFMSSDNKELWYHVQNGAGGASIFRAPAPFATGAAVAELASGTDDTLPVLSYDGLTLYFSSTRPGGQGQKDMWFAKRASKATAFQTPTNLNVLNGLLNTASDDRATWISPDDCRLYFLSDRSGSTIAWVAERPK